MSTKNNLLVAGAALALGMTVAAEAKPVCEGLLNDLSVTQFGVAEVTGKGAVIVIVETTVGGVASIRPVADSSGNVRVYASSDAALNVSKKANIAPGVNVRFVKMEASYMVGDPVVALKTKFKAFKKEAAASLVQATAMVGKLSAAVSQGWDVAVGTPEGKEYLDLMARQVSIAEWQDYNAAKLVTLAASLTAAGVDPLTVV